jgi:hypothetical protein
VSGAANKRNRGGRFATFAIVATLVAMLGLCLAAGQTPAAAAAGEKPALSDEQIAALVVQLGDPDYAVREAATLELASLGARAADAVLTAAEVTGDVEVSLRARWLAESLPMVVEGDAAAAAALVDGFSRRGFGERLKIMHRLLRLEDDAGIEPLARITRLERTAAGSRIAAALVVREWSPDDPAWPGIAARVLVGVGQSRRPAARFLRAFVNASTAESPAQASAAIEEMVAAAGKGDELIGLPQEELLGITRTDQIFSRCLAQMLSHQGRQDEALAEAARLLASADDEADPDAQKALELQWLASHGIPQAVDLIADRLADPDVSPLLVYAAAAAWQARNEPKAIAQASTLALVASRRLADGSMVERLQAAILLARWGGISWAVQEYQGVLNDPNATLAQRALATTLFAEFLHDQARDAEAAEVIHKIFAANGDAVEQTLMQLERDPRAIRSRMLFFRAKAAVEAGERRQLLEESVRAYPKDVDTLIALYKLPDNTPAQQAEAAARVVRAAERIDEEIRALPDEPGSKNEYAWLVSNTEGDLAKATRYSRQSLEASFDNASYLDTLAHCQAAAGDITHAIRTQRLALRHEPHSLLVRQNYQRFISLETKPNTP